MATRRGFPVVMKHRVAYALAAVAHGGRDDAHMPDWNLLVADFRKTTQEQFDAWIPPPPTAPTGSSMARSMPLKGTRPVKSWRPTTRPI